jgi:hypothetical protein
MTGGIATKVLKTFRETASIGRKKPKKAKGGDDSDDDEMTQRHGRGADYRGKQRGNFANGRDLKPAKARKGSGFKSKAKYKRKK